MLSERNKALLIAVEKGYYINKEGEVFKNDKIVKGSISKNKRKSFKVRINNSKNMNVNFHRLQGYQKFGDKIFKQDIVVRHLDSDSLNNSKDNIGIGTQSDNMMDIEKSKRIERAINASSFIKIHNHEEIQQYYQKVKSYKKTMNKFNISSKGTLHYILNKQKE